MFEACCCDTSVKGPTLKLETFSLLPGQKFKRKYQGNKFESFWGGDLNKGKGLQLMLINPGSGQILPVTVSLEEPLSEDPKLSYLYITSGSPQMREVVEDSSNDSHLTTTKVMMGQIRAVFRGKKIDPNRNLNSKYVSDDCVTVAFDKIALTFIFYNDNQAEVGRLGGDVDSVGPLPCGGEVKELYRDMFQDVVDGYRTWIRANDGKNRG